jgi:hypothetical protein
MAVKISRTVRKPVEHHMVSESVSTGESVQQEVTKQQSMDEILAAIKQDYMVSSITHQDGKVYVRTRDANFTLEELEG